MFLIIIITAPTCAHLGDVGGVSEQGVPGGGGQVLEGPVGGREEGKGAGTLKHGDEPRHLERLPQNTGAKHTQVNSLGET